MSSNNLASLESTNTKLKVGLIVDSALASKYVYELAEWAQTQNDLVISHILVQKARNVRLGQIENGIRSPNVTTFLNWIRLKSFAFITKIEKLRLRGKKHFKDHLKLFNLKEIVAGSITITPLTSNTSLVCEYPVEDCQKIKNLDLDLLILCGSGILSGELLKSTRLGVISLRHCDNRINRGGPPGFWEVYFKQDNTGFVIHQLTDTHDGWNVLFRGSFTTRTYFLANQASLYTHSNCYLKVLLHNIATARALPMSTDPQPYFNPSFEMPNLMEQLKYISSIGWTISLNAFRKFFLNREHRWGVAFMTSDWKTLDMWRANKIRNPPNHFLADPFVISEGNREYCFVEDYDYQSSRGSISVYELKKNIAERLGEAIVEPFHVSFPYLFRFDSKIYMCPETAENNEIRLYECVTFPLKWKLYKVLMSNVSAVDTMIFERDGLWWLFTNIDSTNTGIYGSELSIFYSDNPLNEEWHSHPKNPIEIDSAHGRNAGIVFDDKWTYRVSQKQGFNSYGKGFSIDRIIILNKYEYCEREFCSVQANCFPKLYGCHHLHSNRNVSVFDYLHYGRRNSYFERVRAFILGREL